MRKEEKYNSFNLNPTEPKIDNKLTERVCGFIDAI